MIFFTVVLEELVVIPLPGCLMSGSSFLTLAVAHFLALVDFFDGIADGRASFGL